MALLCSSFQVGQVTFWVNSMYDSLIYSDTPAICILFAISTGTRIRTLIKGFGDLYSTVELFPCIKPPNPLKGERRKLLFLCNKVLSCSQLSTLTKLTHSLTPFGAGGLILKFQLPDRHLLFYHPRG